MNGKFFGLGRRPIITVVQPTQSIMGKHAIRGYASNSAPRRSLAQPKVRAVFVMVGDVLGKQPLQAPLVENKHMVEQLAAAAPHPTLGDTLLASVPARTALSAPCADALLGSSVRVHCRVKDVRDVEHSVPAPRHGRCCLIFAA
jgi:hypothetical protein